MSNRNVIRLSDYHQQLIDELSSKPSSRSLFTLVTPSKVTVLAIILSITFHAVLVAIGINTLKEYQHKKFQTLKTSNIIHIKIVSDSSSASSENNNQSNSKDSFQEFSLVHKLPEKPKLKPEKLPNKAKTTNKYVDKVHSDILVHSNTAVLEQKNKEIELDPLVYDKNDVIEESIPNAFNEKTIVFNPVLKQRIKRIQKEKFKRLKTVRIMRKQKENEYFEYKSVGNSQTVRINGNCYAIPKTDAFALSPNVWSQLGNCENNINKINIEAPELKYRYNRSN